MTKHQPYPPAPFYDRLTLLSKLEDGWLDGEGKAPTAEALKAASVLGPALPQDVYLYVYPTEAGGVSLEWADRHGGHEIEILPDGHLSLLSVERAMTEQPATEATELDNPQADALAAEWHRRHQRLEELTKGPNAQVAIVEHVRGELVGLRGALGILLGGQVQGGTADFLGWVYYREWLRRQEGQS